MFYNPQIHHRRSIRLKGYDYSQAGLYFITVCINDRKCLFGEIENEKMILNDAGKIADDCWSEIPNHFPNTVLHEHIVMPNHVHGIVEITDRDVVGVENNPIVVVGIQNFESLQQTTQNPKPRQHQYQKIIPRSVGSIIRGYKIGVTKWFRNNSNIKTVWQRNFHEHIIRSADEYNRISDYIINNPKNWNNDDLKK